MSTGAPYAVPVPVSTIYGNERTERFLEKMQPFATEVLQEIRDAITPYAEIYIHGLEPYCYQTVMNRVELRSLKPSPALMQAEGLEEAHFINTDIFHKHLNSWARQFVENTVGLAREMYFKTSDNFFKYPDPEEVMYWCHQWLWSIFSSTDKPKRHRAAMLAYTIVTPAIMRWFGFEVPIIKGEYFDRIWGSYQDALWDMAYGKVYIPDEAECADTACQEYTSFEKYLRVEHESV